MKKGEPLCTLGGNVTWNSPFGKQYVGSTKNKKIGLLCDPGILFLDIYHKKRKTLT